MCHRVIPNHLRCARCHRFLGPQSSACLRAQIVSEIFLEENTGLSAGLCDFQEEQVVTGQISGNDNKKTLTGCLKAPQEN